jgi:hypothetical protein
VADPNPIDEDVPKLPRGRGITLSVPQLVRILGLIAVLVVLLVMQKPCSNAVSKFVTGFDGSGSAGPGSAGSGAGSAARRIEDYERLRPGMTDVEVKAAIERARVKAAGSAGSTTVVAPETTMPGTNAPSR